MTEMDKPPFRLTLLLIDGFALLSYAAMVEPFRAANLLAGAPRYEIRNLPAAGAAARASSGALVPASAGAGTGRPDLFLVVAGGDPFAFEDTAAFRLLGRMARAGVALGGVSGGPVILARAGLMAGRRMTVHWEHAPALAQLMPELLVERSLYVIDRDRITCGGGAAPMDLAHHLIARRQGAAFARRVSDWFMHTEIRGGGAPQRAGAAARYAVADPRLADALEMMEQHLADPLSLPQIAAIVGVSGRQLNRSFQAAFGVSAMRFYRNLRLDRARGLLASSSLSLGEIAAATGFAAPAHFSRVFSARFGAPPSVARRAARAR